MTSLSADVNPVFVDRRAGATSAPTRIMYEKESSYSLWERVNDAAWERINEFARTGRGDRAALKGVYPITLTPGDFYDVAVYENAEGPLSSHARLVTTLRVFGLLRHPDPAGLITDRNRNVGGTWSGHQVVTSIPTRVVTIGVTRTPPTTDADNFPRLSDVEGQPTAPLTAATSDHRADIVPLVPGHDYNFAVVVADAGGNWDTRVEQFTTLRRRLSVQFKTLLIYNDGDPFTAGEGEFWFSVHSAASNGALGSPGPVLGAFHLPERKIEDNFETRKDYDLLPFGFTYAGPLTVVKPTEPNVKVRAIGIEYDGLAANEGAGDLVGKALPLPPGRGETVTNQALLVDAPTTTTDDDFHFAVDVAWSVAYEI